MLGTSWSFNKVSPQSMLVLDVVGMPVLPCFLAMCLGHLSSLASVSAIAAIQALLGLLLTRALGY